MHRPSKPRISGLPSTARTDVAREASAIVLLDDDFGSIVRTIRLGRRIYDNLRKAIEYIVAVHIPIAGLCDPAVAARAAADTHADSYCLPGNGD